MRIALDATYSLGRDLSGVGVYSLELMDHLARLSPETDFRWLYRPHRLQRALRESLPANAHRGLLLDHAPRRTSPLFHGLNQRLPMTRFARQVVTFHDLFVMTAEYSTASFRARFTAQARHAAAEADRIIAVSHFTAKQVVDLLGVEPGRIEVIPHGVRSLPLTPAPRENVILHVGAIQKRKNLVRLVHAFDAIPPDWWLVLAGSSGYGAEEIQQAIERSRSGNRILVTGYLTPRELASWYSRASVFAFPSLDEGFGMPVLEAMAAGIPVLASKTSALGEVCGDAALLVNPLSDDEITVGLESLTSDPALRERFTEAGRVRAASFTWESAAAATLAVYRRVAGQASRF